MSISIHLAPHRGHLVASLGAVIGEARLGVFDTELIAVPSYALGQWARQHLAHTIIDPSAGAPVGISAGLEFHARGVLATLFLPAASGWEQHRLAWEILQIIDVEREPWADPLRDYFGPPSADESVRRYAGARRIAQLFLDYARERPEMLRAWGRGENSVDVPALQQWQPELYRHLVAVHGEPPALLAAEAAAEAERRGVRRLHVFGYAHFSAADLEFLRAASDAIEVHLWISAATVNVFEEAFARGRAGEVPELRRDFLEVGDWGMRGLAAGSKELAATLGRELPGAHLDVTGNDAHEVPIQIHSCHGPSRQVEVLREVLTDAFENDPSLQPRDVLILCPDVEQYAPLFSATFNAAGVHPGGNLWVEVAGRNRTIVNPLLDLARVLVHLVSARVSSTDLVDLLHREVVQQRFGWVPDQIEMLTGWIATSGIRWGFDAEHRAAYGLPTDQNTIQSGIQRLLLGTALGQGGAFHGIAPAAPVGSTEIETLGTFAEFLTRLRAGITSLKAADSAEAWAAELEALIDQIAIGEPAHRSELARGLAHIAEGGDSPVTRADVAALIEELSQPGGSIAFLRGGMTLATLTAENIVPHRIIALVGIDDDAFPRKDSHDGDSLLRAEPRVGDRSRRYEDQQAFLDAIAAASDSLIITYSGQTHDGDDDHPPAAPLVTLINDLTRASASDVVTAHPLHSFDAKYFDGTGLVSYDARSARAAEARRSPLPPQPLLDQPLDTPEPKDTALGDLRSFFDDPVKYFVTRVLEANLAISEDTLEDEIPLARVGLESWAIGNRLVRTSEGAGWVDLDLDTERARGMLPPGQLGEHSLQTIATPANAVIEEARRHARGPAETIDIDIDLDGRRVRGVVSQVYGDTVVNANFSSLKAGHKFAAWLSLLALSASHPGRPWAARVIARAKEEAEVYCLSAPEPALAREILGELIQIFDAGNREPLPMSSGVSEAWARAVLAGGGPQVEVARAAGTNAASTPWESSHAYHTAEREQPHHKIAWGEEIPFSELLAIPAPPDERWFTEPSRFGQLALRTWGRVFDYEC